MKASLTTPDPARSEPRVTDGPSTTLLSIAAIAGGAAGFSIAALGRDLDEILVWVVVATALGSATGVSAVVGWVSWRRLRVFGAPNIPAETTLVGSVAVLAVIAAFVGYLGPSQRSPRGTLLIGIAIVGGLAPVLAMARVRNLTSPAHQEADAKVVETLISLQVIVVRQLRALGALIALTTLALAVSPALESPTADGSGLVLVLGGTGSAVVALAYVPVAMSLRNRVGELCARLFPVPDAMEGPAVLQSLQNRRELMRLITGDRGIYDELQVSIVVLGPLITASVGRAIGG